MSSWPRAEGSIRAVFALFVTSRTELSWGALDAFTISELGPFFARLDTVNGDEFTRSELLAFIIPQLVSFFTFLEWFGGYVCCCFVSIDQDRKGQVDDNTGCHREELSQCTFA